MHKAKCIPFHSPRRRWHWRALRGPATHWSRAVHQRLRRRTPPAGRSSWPSRASRRVAFLFFFLFFVFLALFFFRLRLSLRAFYSYSFLSLFRVSNFCTEQYRMTPDTGSTLLSASVSYCFCSPFRRPTCPSSNSTWKASRCATQVTLLFELRLHSIS